MAILLRRRNLGQPAPHLAARASAFSCPRRLILPRGVATSGEARAFRRRRIEGKPEMESLIARVAAAAGITLETARRAVALVLDFIKREAPEGAVDALLAEAPELNAIVASSASTGGEGMSPALKGLMGTGAGAMGGGGLVALGGDLMALGLDMAQIHAVGKVVFDYARKTAGDDVLGEISAAIPGLAQFV
jgi:hypothetical protein